MKDVGSLIEKKYVRYVRIKRGARTPYFAAIRPET